MKKGFFKKKEKRTRGVTAVCGYATRTSHSGVLFHDAVEHGIDSLCLPARVRAYTEVCVGPAMQPYT